MDRVNAFRESVENDDVILGARAMNMSPLLVEVYGELGLDFVWLDFEHAGKSPYDSTEFEHLTRAAEAGDIELLVRLPSGDPELVRKVLDAGVRTLLIPRVKTADEIQEAVEAAHFDYAGGVGERGIAAGRASTWGANMNDHTTKEDDNILVGTMIENRAAVQNLDEILSVPELGFAFIGPSDLSVSLGHPLKTDHPDIRDTVAEIRETCVSADVPVGKITADAKSANNAIEDGFQILRIGGEVSAVRQILDERIGNICTGN